MKITQNKISELSASELEEIRVLLDAHFCTVFHEVDFNRIASEVMNTEFSYKLAYNSVGRLIALCPLHSVKGGLLTRTYSNPAKYDIRYGGWIYDNSETILPELMEHLRPSSNEMFTYWSVPQISGDDYSFIEHKIKYETSVIDLQLSLDDIIHKCISRKRRQTIRSASRKGVVVEELELSNLDVFTEQCDFLKKSVGFEVRPSAFYNRLFEVYHSRKKMAAFATKVGSSYLASGMIIGNKHVMHLWVAGKPRGSIPQGVPRQDLLVWETIKWSKENGCRYFDLCVVESVKLPDIARFKLGFSENIVPFYCINKKGLSARVLSRLQKTRPR